MMTVNVYSSQNMVYTIVDDRSVSLKAFGGGSLYRRYPSVIVCLFRACILCSKTHSFFQRRE